jgi:hypothetical protein
MQFVNMATVSCQASEIHGSRFVTAPLNKLFYQMIATTLRIYSKYEVYVFFYVLPAFSAPLSHPKILPQLFFSFAFSCATCFLMRSCIASTALSSAAPAAWFSFAHCFRSACALSQSFLLS